MKVRKYFYQLAVEISCQVGEKTVSFKKKVIRVVAPQKNVAIAIAKKIAIRECKKRFPSVSDTNIKVKIDSQNIKITGSKLVDTKKKRKPRSRMLPFGKNQEDNRNIELQGLQRMENKVIQVGDRVIFYPQYLWKDLYLILLPSEKIEVIDGRIIIRGQNNEYVKILAVNQGGEYLMCRFEREELENGDRGFYPEFFEEGTLSMRLSKEEYKRVMNLAKIILKDKGGE
ncbi:MAG: hypothetical protein ACP5OX_00495 [Minisyncoccia bacterium]